MMRALFEVFLFRFGDVISTSFYGKREGDVGIERVSLLHARCLRHSANRTLAQAFSGYQLWNVFHTSLNAACDCVGWQPTP
jgi:hypothetical protein